MWITNIFVPNEAPPFAATYPLKAIFPFLVRFCLRQHVIVIADRFENKGDSAKGFAILADNDAVNHPVTLCLWSVLLADMALSESRERK